MKRVILSVLMRVAAGVTMVTAHDYHGWSDFVANGNILSRTAIGTYTYDVSGKPHAVLSVTNPQGLVSQETLETSFGDLGKIEQIEQGDYETTIDYGPDGERWRSVLQDDGSVTRTVLYAGDYEMVTTGSVTRHFYYLGNGIIVMKEGSTVTPLVAVADHLGSITHLLTADGTSIFKASYDAWGRQTVSTNTIGFHRGYCGHEMLPEYGLINMRSAFGRLPPTGRKNGRLYDPLLGRFLSPDNYVQQPDNSQNFNRYTYCLNNPLKYNDPSG
ncbi:MAG: RHS repeat-associated core domain-containing protein, partial [Bacteroidales bacterium]|nr:RHS repeat-associated core domain-containing protein [Bacteroidales bacterium]